MSGGGGVGAAPSFVALREQSRRELTECIDKLRGPKALVLDPSLSGPLGLVAEKQLLKEHGVEKTYHLKSAPLETDQRRMVFLVRDTILNIKAVAAQVKYNQQRREKMEYLVCLVPRRTIMCERVLEEEGVYNAVQLADFHLGLIAVEEDVLSMELPEAFRQSTSQGDMSSMAETARSLLRLEHAVGRIPVIKGKGLHAKAVCDMLVRMRLEALPEAEGTSGGGAREGAGGEEEVMIDELILVDRSSDLVTPMLSQLTYQGLIDDMYGINNGIVELPTHIVLPNNSSAPPPAAGKGGKVKVYLNSSDHLFSQLRDANFEQVGALVKKRATFLKSVQDEKDELQHRSVGEIKAYVRKLKEINIQQEKNLLSLHTSIALQIKQTVSDSGFSRRLELEQALLQGGITADKAVEVIQSLIYSALPLLKVMRLICLTCLVTDGIKKLDALKTELIQVYGFEIIIMLERLEDVGLLKRADAPSGIAGVTGMSLSSAGVSVAKLTNKLTLSSGWEAIKKRFQLVVEPDAAGRMPVLAESYSGYVPLSVRIAEQALFPPAPGWSSLEDSMSLIEGPLFQIHSPPVRSGGAPETPAPPDAGAVPKTRHTALIFYVGGVTAAEVALIRVLAQESNHQPDGVTRRCILGCTKLLSGDQLLGSFYDPFPNAIRPDKEPACKPHSSALR